MISIDLVHSQHKNNYSMAETLISVVRKKIYVIMIGLDSLKADKLRYKMYMLRFNPKWDMHWLRTKQNREWFASKACSQNSGFSFGSFKYISAIM